MSTVIYADILIVTNIAVNYLLLRATAAITSCNFKAVRFLLSSAAGGVFSLIIFIENIPAAVNLIIKIAFLALMVLIAFGAVSLKAYLKCCSGFFLCNFAFAGIMLAINIFAIPYSSLYKNGVVYFDIDIFTLTVASVICYAIISIISKLIKNRVPQNHIYPIRIFYGEKNVEGTALFDSGNSLCDCFSGKPVIIAERNIIKNLLGEKDVCEMKNFRLIPFTTIQSGGALPSFMADKVEITLNGKWIGTENIYVAVTEKKIVSGGYSALIGAPFFDNLNNHCKGGKTKYEKKADSTAEKY